jgi:hypothetical protein
MGELGVWRGWLSEPCSLGSAVEELGAGLSGSKIWDLKLQHRKIALNREVSYCTEILYISVTGQIIFTYFLFCIEMLSPLSGLCFKL